MAIYEFKCDRCGTVFTSEFVLGDDPERPDINCPRCGSSEVKQLLSTGRGQDSDKSTNPDSRPG